MSIPHFVLGIDASRNRSGGARVHLLGILRDSDPTAAGISAVHVWSYPELLEALPAREWLHKHSPPELVGSLARQIWWQRRCLPVEAAEAGCDILLNTDAGTVCRFQPSVTMSRDMLSYELRELRRYGWSRITLRLLALRYIQSESLRRAVGAIFLTAYAARVIRTQVRLATPHRIIPHGISDVFRISPDPDRWPEDPGCVIRCVYVSNAEPYKHQWVVVEAIAELVRQGFRLKLTLAGALSGFARRRVEEAAAKADSEGSFLHCLPAVPHAEIREFLRRTDIFIFASSCENMPNTLVEAMAAGLPIACSDRGPMPEVLRDAGVYFDPEDSHSIVEAVKTLLLDRELRLRLARKAAALAETYSWGKCGRETWQFARESLARHRREIPRTEI
jgi:glycosyltransferase involved in cell wall biosynthesis